VTAPALPLGVQRLTQPCWEIVHERHGEPLMNDLSDTSPHYADEVEAWHSMPDGYVRRLRDEPCWEVTALCGAVYGRGEHFDDPEDAVEEATWGGYRVSAGAMCCEKHLGACAAAGVDAFLREIG
jgi:hypothetical protein